MCRSLRKAEDEMNARSLAAVLALGLVGYACDSDVITPVEEGIALELIAEGLTAPVALVEPPDGSGRLFVVDQAGVIRIIDADGDLLPAPFLDVSSRMVQLRTSFDERGLLGLAFHPNYAANGRFFVFYSAPLRTGQPPGRADYDHTAHISEFHVSATNPDLADPSSERIVLQVDEPQFNHNGGTLAFGPGDGFLYISLGDGGGGNDTGLGHVDDWYAANAGGNGQDLTQNLLGSILRIDIDGANPYQVPSDNPFVGEEGLDEVWAYGFRNPYRFSFDMAGDNSLLVGDAGQELWEEVSVVVRGGNYGWNVKEGTHCFSTDDPESSPASCPSVDQNGDPLIDPVIEFRNSKNSADGLGVVVVGGHVYRGQELPELDGSYLFGVWSDEFDTPNGAVFVATRSVGAGQWNFGAVSFSNTPGGDLGSYLLGFGQDSSGELYLLTSNSTPPAGTTGRVYRMVRGD
jgi:glucose/arabinose dehydrogenase